MKSFEIDDAINMFEQAIEQQDTDFPNEYCQFVGWLRELKWRRSLEKKCGTCKHCDKDEQEEPCVRCLDPDDPHDADYYWECGYEGTTKQEDVPDINVGDMINCTDCIKHGGDRECDRAHCRKGTKQQATKASDCISRQAVSSWLKQYGQDVLHGKYKFSLMYIWKNLMDLPSAQPELYEDAVSRQRLLSDLKELIDAWKKYPVMAEQIKGVETAIGYVKVIPSVKPDSKELSSTHKALDTISRQAAIDALSRIFNQCEEIEAHLPEGDPDRTGYKMYPDYVTVREYLHQLPSAEPGPLSDAYMKAVWTWLLDYQNKAAELEGRYTPYEVLSWVANDWRKEHERLDKQTVGN